MPDNAKYPRPTVKIVNVLDGTEEIVPMPDADYAIWLENCLAYERKIAEAE